MKEDNVIASVKKIELSGHERLSAQLFYSARGQYLMGKAISLAVEVMKNLPKRHQVPDQIDDLKYLLEHLFALYKEIEQQGPRKQKEIENKLKMEVEKIRSEINVT